MNQKLPQPFKYLFCICLLFAALLPAKAQYVTIPDAVFVDWLQSNGYADCMLGNLLDTTCSGVLSATSMSCSAVSISDLTGIQYFKNLTSLDCSNDSLYNIPALPPDLNTLNCDFNNLSSLPVLPASLGDLECIYNFFTSLPTLPGSLQTLDCDGNPLTNLPILPDSLQNLYCEGSALLTSLPVLPASLNLLYCSANQLTSLPVLPASLMDLDCSFNQLTSLPALPGSLQTLDCEINQLTVLPALPASLTGLDCDNNSLTGLPDLPASLVYLDCSFNQLTSLTILPGSLQYLYCEDNQLTSLPILPGSLQSLYCEVNQLTNLPILPGSLQYLNCQDNQLTSLPILPGSLQTLNCEVNQLTSLPILPGSLQYLYCSYNQLTSLPALPASLNTLYCYSNQLASLPVLPGGLDQLECGDNRLTSLPALPGNLGILDCHANFNLTCLPELKNIVNLFFDSTAINCLSNYGNVTNSTPLLSSLPLCGIFNPGGCQRFWNISGQCYYDENRDCIFDSIDVGTNYVKTDLYNNGNLVQQTYGGGQGFYSFNSGGNGNYVVEVDTSNLPFTVECPGSDYYADAITATDSLFYNNNFAFQCRTEGFDIGVQSILNNYVIPRPAAVFTLYILAGDMSQLFGAHCASGVGGQVQLIFSGALTYEGPAHGALTPTSVSGDTITWAIADYGAVNNNSAFNLLFKIDSLAVPGTSLCFTMNVTPLAGDYNPSNNTLSYCFNVVNSLDPNEKEVYPTSIDSAGQWLTYTIRFQNTGTSPAENIQVSDTLSANLNPASFQLLAFSAENLVQIAGNIVNFYFANINLPDSATSDSASQGYVQYRIQTISNLQPGAVISNNASIYFDLNPPVVTNTVRDTAVDSLPCAPNYTNISQGICSGDTFYIDTMPYYITGTYTDTIINSNGCDSIVTLNLTVNNNRETIYSYAACGSYVFNNRTLTQSNNYYDTLQTVSGCDSIVTLYLTVNPVYDIIISDTVCGSIVFGNNTLTQSGTYYDSLQTVNGCDSIVTLNLTVYNSYDTVISDTVCGSFVFNNQTLTQSGTYYDTLQTVNGCDSIITLQLTVNTIDTLLLPEALCTGDTVYMWGNAYYTSGNYMMTYTNVSGCDSLVILSVVVSPATFDTLAATICAGQTFIVGEQIIHTQPGNYTDTIINSNGCDSIVSLTLVVNPAYYDTTSASICSGDTFYIGNTGYTIQGSYNDTLQSVAGCDSIVSLTLTVNPTPVVTLSWDSLVAEDILDTNTGGLGFWCTNIFPVVILKGGNPPGGVYSGEGVSDDTLSVFLLANHEGPLDTIFYSYQNPDGCLSTASDTLFATVCGGIEPINPDNALSLYPNPANSLLYIKTEGLHPQTLTIYDVNGQAVLTQPFTPGLDIHNLSAGVYLLEVNSVEGVARKRWVKM